VNQISTDLGNLPRELRSTGGGITPLQNSSGGKERLGRITKMGDKYLRKLLVVGATSPARRARHRPAFVGPRLVDLLARKPMRLASVAMANRMARIVWAVMTRGEEYRKSHAPMLAAENYMV
jgi:transposase